MKIVQCTPYFPPSVGGVSRSVQCLSKELRNLGHEVTVLAFNFLSGDYPKGIKLICNARLPSREIVDGVEVFRFSYSSAPLGFKFSLPLAYQLIGRDADIIHLHGFFHFPNVLLDAICGKIIRKPVCLTTHGLHETISAFSSFHHSALEAFANSGVRLVLRNIDSFIVHSSQDKEHLTKWGAPRTSIHCIPHGITIEDSILSTQNIQEVRKTYGVPASSIVLCVSRIARNKGLHDLILAASIVTRRLENVVFLIIGPTYDMQYRDSLVKLIRGQGLNGRVLLKDNVPDFDLELIYRAASIFVLPSEQETGPLVILEAMAAGCPVISTPVGVVPELISNGVNGIIIPVHDPQEMANSILNLLNDATTMSRFAEKGKKVVRNYSWEEIARRTLEVYVESISEAKQSKAKRSQ